MKVIFDHYGRVITAVIAIIALMSVSTLLIFGDGSIKDNMTDITNGMMSAMNLSNESSGSGGSGSGGAGGFVDEAGLPGYRTLYSLDIPEDSSVDDVKIYYCVPYENTEEIVVEEPLSASISSLFTPMVALAEENDIIELNGVRYTISDDDVLVISGTGRMRAGSIKNKLTENNIPTPSSVVIQEGVTNVGNSAFWNYPLTSVVLPSTITAIDNSAFSGCTSLSSINLPDGLETIGGQAFWCTGLTNIYIPDSVTSIEGLAFASCPNLESVRLSNNISKIESLSFSDNEKLSEITIGSGTTTIDGLAFNNCTSISKVNFAGTIDQWAEIDFTSNTHKPSVNPVYNCKQLYINGEKVTSVNLTNATKIGDYAFAGFDFITSVSIPNSVASIGVGAFEDCSNISSITISGNNVTSIGDYAFSNCSSLVSLALPNSITKIGVSSFADCSHLTAINLPNSLKTIENYAFTNCSSLTTIELPNSLETIKNGAFKNCTSLTSIIIPNGVTSIGTNICYGCTALTTAVVGNGITSVSSRAFEKCSNLSNVTLGSNVSKIESNAFAWCSKLKEIRLPDGLKTIGTQAFFRSALDTVYLPSSITTIESNAFMNVGAYTKLYCETQSVADLLVFGTNYGTSGNMSVVVDSSKFTEKVSYVAENNNLAEGNSTAYTQEGLYTYWQPSDLAQNEIEIISYDNTDVTNWSVPSQIDGYTVKRVQSCTYLTNLETVKFPESVDTLVASQFSNCSNLKSVTLSSKITIIPSSAFSGCTSLTKAPINKNITYIGSSAFANCKSITSVSIPDSVATIGNYAFRGTGLNEAYVGKNATLGTACFGSLDGAKILIPKEQNENQSTITKIIGTTATRNGYASKNCTVYLENDTLLDTFTNYALISTESYNNKVVVDASKF